MNDFFGWVLGLVALIPGMGHPQPPTWNGYVEDDYTYASAPTGGVIEAIPVAEGQLVQKGEALFVLEARPQIAQLAAAKARADASASQVAAAQATLANLRSGARPEELQVTQASLTQAEANLSLAQQNFTRSQDLYAKGTVPRSQLDQAQANFDSASATVAQLKAQLAVARLPARDDQISAAEANVAAAQSAELAARADADAAAVALSDRTVSAPAAARVERLFYKVGEVAGAGAPVASLSATGAMKVKFYVNEADRHQFSLGQTVSVACDGCAQDLTASISFFASDPQFTPPIIYSRDERSRLVFLTEATLADQNDIQPGQPVSVGLAP